jgi:hypothetical protein
MSRLVTILVALTLVGVGAFYFGLPEPSTGTFSGESSEQVSAPSVATDESLPAPSPGDVAVLVTKLDATRPLLGEDGEIGVSEFPPVSVGEFLDPDDMPPRQVQALVSVGEPRDPDDEDQRVFLTEVSVGEFKDPDDELATLTEVTEPVSYGDFKDPDELALPSGIVSLGDPKDPDDENP